MKSTIEDKNKKTFEKDFEIDKSDVDRFKETLTELSAEWKATSDQLIKINQFYKELDKFNKSTDWEIASNETVKEKRFDLILYNYIHGQLDKETEKSLKILIANDVGIEKRYKILLSLTNYIAKTYSAETMRPMPESTKKILNKYREKKSFRFFSIASLSSIAAIGWLGTISLGTYQFLGIMATTTAPSAIMRSAPIEDDIEFDLLDIGSDDCITLMYDMPDSPAAITKQICLD